MGETTISIIVKALDQASAQLATLFSGIGSATQSFTDKMKDAQGAAVQLGAVTGTAFAGLSLEIWDAANANEAWNKSVADINNTLENTKSSLPVSEVEAFSQKMSQSTLFSEQSVLTSAQLVLGNKSLQGSFKDVLGVAADMATHMRVDIPQATQALMKVLNDPSTAISKLANTYNIDLDPAQKKMIMAMGKINDLAGAQAAIMKAVETQIGGAAAAADSASGTGFTRLTNTIETLQKHIGATLNPSLDKLAGTISEVVEKVMTWIDAHPRLTGALILTAATVLGLTTLLTGLMATIITIGLAIATFVATPMAMLMAAWVAGGIAVAAFATAVALNWDKIKATVSSAIDGLLGMLDKLKSAWNDSPLGKGINAAAGAIGGVMNGIGNAVSSTVKMFASGGIVNGPTLAMVGEAGPEAIIPLSAFNGGMGLTGRGAGGGGNIIINLNGNISDASTARMYADMIARQIQSQLKLSNYV